MVNNTTKNSFIFSAMIPSVDTAVAVAQQTFFPPFCATKEPIFVSLQNPAKFPLNLMSAGKNEHQ